MENYVILKLINESVHFLENNNYSFSQCEN